jgi:hypothetical protein
MRKDLKRALRWKFGSQIAAARQLTIPENRLSYLVQGHCDPNDRERKVLKRALGVDFFSEEEDAQTFVEKYLRSEVGALMTLAEPTKATK